MKPDFIEYIQDHVVLADGALGSYLFERGVERGRNLDQLTARPDIFLMGGKYCLPGLQIQQIKIATALHAALKEI